MLLMTGSAQRADGLLTHRGCSFRLLYCLWRRPDAGQRVSPLIPDAIDPQPTWADRYRVFYFALVP